LESRIHSIFGDAVRSEDLNGDPRCVLENTQEEVFHADIFIFEPPGLFLSPLKDLIQARGTVALAGAVDLGKFPQFLTERGRDLLGAGSDFLEERNQDALSLLREGQEKVLHIDGLMLHLVRRFLGRLNGLLGLEGELVKAHGKILQRKCLFLTLTDFQYKT
jgi:hypothetical protein